MFETRSRNRRSMPDETTSQLICTDCVRKLSAHQTYQRSLKRSDVLAANGLITLVGNVADGVYVAKELRQNRL